MNEFYKVGKSRIRSVFKKLTLHAREEEEVHEATNTDQSASSFRPFSPVAIDLDEMNDAGEATYVPRRDARPYILTGCERLSQGGLAQPPDMGVSEER